jgi:hypothetical protein
MLILLTCAALPVQAQQVYKWKDEQGKVHYSNRLEDAQGAPVEKLETPKPPPSYTVQPAGIPAVAEASAPASPAQAEVVATKPAAPREGRLSPSEVEHCKSERSAIEQMERDPTMVVRYRPKGGRATLSDEERARTIEVAKAQYAANCNR